MSLLLFYTGTNCTQHPSCDSTSVVLMLSWSAGGTAASPVEPWLVTSGSKYSKTLGEAPASEDVSNTAVRSSGKYAVTNASAAWPSRRPEQWHHVKPCTIQFNPMTPQMTLSNDLDLSNRWVEEDEISYFLDDIFTGLMTQPAVSKHWRRVVKSSRGDLSLTSPCYNNTTCIAHIIIDNGNVSK